MTNVNKYREVGEAKVGKLLSERGWTSLFKDKVFDGLTVRQLTTLRATGEGILAADKAEESAKDLCLRAFKEGLTQAHVRPVLEEMGYAVGSAKTLASGYWPVTVQVQRKKAKSSNKKKAAVRVARLKAEFNGSAKTIFKLMAHEMGYELCPKKG